MAFRALTLMFRAPVASNNLRRRGGRIFHHGRLVGTVGHVDPEGRDAPGVLLLRVDLAVVAQPSQGFSEPAQPNHVEALLDRRLVGRPKTLRIEPEAG